MIFNLATTDFESCTFATGAWELYDNDIGQLVELRPNLLTREDLDERTTQVYMYSEMNRTSVHPQNKQVYIISATAI